MWGWLGPRCVQQGDGPPCLCTCCLGVESCSHLLGRKLVQLGPWAVAPWGAALGKALQWEVRAPPACSTVLQHLFCRFFTHNDNLA